MRRSARMIVPAAFVVLLVLAVLLALLAGRDGDGAGTSQAVRVSYVIDGDTVIVDEEDGERVHVRLIGIDTPEISHSGGPSECFGTRAARLTRSLALGREVVLLPGRERHDRYGRVFGHRPHRRRPGRSQG